MLSPPGTSFRFALVVTALTVLPLAEPTQKTQAPTGHRSGLAPRTDSRRPEVWARFKREAPPLTFQAEPGKPIRFPRELLLRTIEPEFEVEEPGDQTPTGPGLFGSLPVQPDSKKTRVGTNRLINDPTGDPPNSTQSENAFAAHGRFLAAGWNDQFDTRLPRSFTGFGYSSDGGETWRDGGILPPADTTDFFYGDPSLTVDENGSFYFASLYSPDGNIGGVSVSRGRFSRDDRLRFGTPVLVAGSATDILDKEWIAADPEDGTLYVTYSRFGAAEDWSQIELVRSRDRGRTWSAPLVLTDSATSIPQGSRPAIGPNHEVYVVYFAVDIRDFSAHMRIRKSTNRGRSFGPEINVGESRGDQTLFVNTVTGPPGFNRPGGVALPSIAIDRSRGDKKDDGGDRGGIYVAWPEAVNFFDDPLGGSGVVPETESNDLPASATPFTLGVTLTGTLGAAIDADWFSFRGKAGQTVEFLLLGSPTRPSDGFLRLFCRNGTTADRVAFSYFGGGVAFVLFTLPSDGTYLLRVLAARPSAQLGDYMVFSGVHEPRKGEVGRDASDIVLSRSSDGRRWTRRQRVNDDPARFDNSLPEVAVDGKGDVHLLWYDHRNDRACGILTDVYATRSRNGGKRFDSSFRVNDGPSTNWSLVGTTFAPNLGDYIALVADGKSVYANWADGRLGSPDSWMAAIGRERRHLADLEGAEPDAASITDASAGPFALHVPNPAKLGSPITIEFALPRPGPAQLEVYSVTGQRVRTLFAGGAAGGVQRLAWDARDRNGSAVAPGVYFVMLRGDGRRLNRRVVLVP